MPYYLVLLIAGMFSYDAFANSADEYVKCKFVHRNAEHILGFSKLADDKEVRSDFGNTTKYTLDSDGHVIAAESADASNSRNWKFYLNPNGKWTIIFNNFKYSINVNDATCAAVVFNPAPSP